MARSRKDPEPVISNEEKRKRLKRKAYAMKNLYVDGLVKKGTMAKFLLKNVRMSNLEFAEEIDDLNKRKEAQRRIEL